MVAEQRSPLAAAGCVAAGGAMTGPQLLALPDAEFFDSVIEQLGDLPPSFFDQATVPVPAIAESSAEDPFDANDINDPTTADATVGELQLPSIQCQGPADEFDDLLDTHLVAQAAKPVSLPEEPLRLADPGDMFQEIVVRDLDTGVAHSEPASQRLHADSESESESDAEGGSDSGLQQADLDFNAGTQYTIPAQTPVAPVTAPPRKPVVVAPAGAAIQRPVPAPADAAASLDSLRARLAQRPTVCSNPTGLLDGFQLSARPPLSSSDPRYSQLLGEVQALRMQIQADNL